MANIPHFGIDVEGRPAVWLKGTEEVEVVGEGPHQGHLANVAAMVDASGKKRELAAWLVPEAGHPTAIAVWVQGAPVGYMSPVFAGLFRPHIEAFGAQYKRPVACFAKLLARGGQVVDAEGNTLAVRLFLPSPL